MTNENDEQIESIVLMNAWEDYALLWQILGEVRAAAPSLPEDMALNEAKRAVRALLKRGLIEVYRRESRLAEFKLLDEHGRDTALDTDAYWRPDERDTVEICVGVTKAGENAYLTNRRDGSEPDPSV